MSKDIFESLMGRLGTIPPGDGTMGESHQTSLAWKNAVLNNELTLEEAGQVLDLSYKTFHIMRSEKAGKEVEL